MLTTRNQFLENLLQSYASYYDIERITLPGSALVAKCTFHVHAEKYVLTKKAVLWDADSHEHVYIFSLPHLTKALYDTYRDIVYENGMALIDPKRGHMYTYLTTLFICDSCDLDARKALKHCRLHKNFLFSFYGWMDFHTAVIELQKNRVDTNHSGHENGKILKRILFHQ